MCDDKKLKDNNQQLEGGTRKPIKPESEQQKNSMRHTAKLFMNGRSQAVRLPINYRFDCDEVYIRKDPQTGDVVISKKPGSWEDFFEMMESIDVPDDFMADRDSKIETDRDLF